MDAELELYLLKGDRMKVKDRQKMPPVPHLCGGRTLGTVIAYEENMTTRTFTGVTLMARRTVLLGSVVGLLLALLLHGLPPLQAQGNKPSEYDIKAAFLYNFLKYVEFPAQTFPAGSSTLTIGV